MNDFNSVVVHISAMFVPGLNDALQIAPVSLSTWLTLLVVAATLLFFQRDGRMAAQGARRALFWRSCRKRNGIRE